MALTLVTGPANAGKAQNVLDSLRAYLARGEDPLLIVPTRADAEHYLRELAGEGAALGARVERFDGLIEEIVRRSGTGGAVLGSLARERVLARAATQTGMPEPGPGLIRAASALIADMRVRRVTPTRLSQALAQAGAGPGTPAASLGLLYQAYERELARIGLQDAERRAVLALDELRRRPVLWRRTPVLFYGFDDLTRLQLDVIETLGRVLDAEVTVSLTYERGRVAFAGRAGTFEELAPVAVAHSELPPREDYYAPRSRAALAHLERSLLEPYAGRVDGEGAVRLLRGGGERAELELVAGEIGGLLREGVPPDEIGIVARSPAAIADLLEEVLSAAGIPFALRRRQPLSSSALGRSLLGLLRSAGSRGTAADLLAWLRAPGMLERPELADLLEIRVRRTGTEDAAGARALWEERGWTLDALDRVREGEERGPLALLDRAGAELERLFLAPRRGRAAVLGEPEAREARALAAARGALSELRDLARRDTQLAPETSAELARTLESVEFSSGERPGLGMVAVLDPLELRARRVRALFLVGLNEGSFPSRSRAQPLISEEESLQIARASGLVLGESRDTLAAERYLLYAALSRPEELLVLSWHAADDDGEPVSRSLFVDDVLDLFDERLSGALAPRPPAPAGPAPAGACAPVPLAPLGEPGVLEDLRGHVWSASSLQVWIACPVRWFIERILRPGPIDPDAEPLARGGLAHAALRDTLAGLARDTGSARLTPVGLARARELLLAALEENERRLALSVAPERRPGLRRRLRADLERYLEYAAGAGSPLEPRHLELGFGSAPGGEGGESELEAFDLGGGVLMRGRIDRVDEDGAGRAVDLRLQELGRAGAVEVDPGREPAGGAVHARCRAAAPPGGRRRLLPAALRCRPARARGARARERDRARLRQGRRAATGSRCARFSTTPSPRHARRPPRRAGESLCPGPLRAPTAVAACIPRSAAASREPGRQAGADRALTEEQEHAAGRRSQDLLLSAAAGSGKTLVLVERFVRAVREDGLAPGRILAITFTERAAGELRERIRARLLELGEREAARDTEAAFVGTFHGFCARLLRAHAPAAGLDPEFTILDEPARRPPARPGPAPGPQRIPGRGRGRGGRPDGRLRHRPRRLDDPLGACAAAQPRAARAAAPAARAGKPDDELHAQAAAACAELDELLRRSRRAYEQLKRERGAVDFDDLELLACELLQSDQPRCASPGRSASSC